MNLRAWGAGVLATVLAAGLVVAPVGSASPVAAGGGATVDVVNTSFSPRTVKVPVGGSVTWRFQDQMTHDATSSQGFWASGPKSTGSTFVHTFTSSGSYPYLCTLHPSMRGLVKVPVSATGSPGVGWRLRWSTVAGAGGRTFDVQVRKPGSSTWKPFRTDTTLPTARFNPGRPGKYAVRARTSDRQSSGWSPAKALRIT
jgi:plastocyanin